MATGLPQGFIRSSGDFARTGQYPIGPRRERRIRDLPLVQERILRLQVSYENVPGNVLPRGYRIVAALEVT